MSRDAAIDTWLRRARKTPDGFGPNEACLDAEVMAAWSDGGLSGEALKLVRAHVLHCARCQVLAAVMAKLESAAAENSALPAGRPSRLKWLGWFVPLAAAAGAVAIWMFVPREPAALKDAPAAPAQMAQARAAEPAAQTPPPSEAPARLATERAVDAVSSTPKLKAEGQAPRDLKRQATEKDANAARLDARAEQQRERGQAAADPKKVDTRVTAPTGATAVPLPPPPPAVAAPAAPPPPPQTMAQASADRAAAASRVSSAGGGAGVGGAGRGGGGGSNAARPSPMAEANLLTKEIVSSDSAIRWRVSAGAVDKSTDAGRTWTSVKTGVTAELMAGASPSPTICWLVGRAGVVLLTSDGETWQRIKFSEVTDLSAVRATDARTATVTTADGREFSTNDGGNTWFRRLPQEN